VLYLSSGTRPDISHTVGVVSRDVASPRQEHGRNFKGLQYLKRTMQRVLKDSPMQIMPLIQTSGAALGVVCSCCRMVQSAGLPSCFRQWLFVQLRQNIWQLRGVITQPLWHVTFPRGDLEDAFGSSATTAGLLPTCRYVLPPESHFFSISGVERPKQAKKYSIRSKKNQDIEKKFPDAKKAFNDASGGFSGPKRAFRLRCDASMRT
jgi:hypothetical protein